MTQVRPVAKAARPAAAPVTVLECDVRHVRMPSLLQLVEGEMYTGRLRFVPGGIVSVRSGAVVAAESAGGLTGIAAMRELFLQSDGQCRLELDASVTGQPLAGTISLVLDGCKLLDEWNELARERFSFAANATMLTPDLSVALDAVRPVLDAMQRGLTLEAAAAETLARRSAIVPHLLRLLDAGVIETGAAAAPHAQAPPTLPAPPAKAAPEPAPKKAPSRASERPASSRTGERPAAVSPTGVRPPARKSPLAQSRPSERPAAAKTGERARPAPIESSLAGAIPSPGMDAKATPPIPEDMDELLARARALIRAGSLDDAETLLRAAIDRNPNDRALAQNLRHVQLRRMQAR